MLVNVVQKKTMMAFFLWRDVAEITGQCHDKLLLLSPHQIKKPTESDNSSTLNMIRHIIDQVWCENGFNKLLLYILVL